MPYHLGIDQGEVNEGMFISQEGYVRDRSPLVFTFCVFIQFFIFNLSILVILIQFMKSIFFVIAKLWNINNCYILPSSTFRNSYYFFNRILISRILCFL
jgi:hypothetical protein